MPTIRTILRGRLQKPTPISLGYIVLALLCLAGEIPATEVEFAGSVVDAKGGGIAGATVKLLETALTTTTDPQGAFVLKGTIPNGIIRRAALTGQGRVRFRDGRLTVEGAGHGRIEWLGMDGRRKVLAGLSGQTVILDLDRESGAGGVFWVRILSDAGETLFRFLRPTGSAHGRLVGGPAARVTVGGAKVAGQADAVGYLLEASAPAFLAKRFLQDAPTRAELKLALLPSSASLKERIQDFIGSGNTLRLAFVKPEAPGARKQLLYHADFAEMAADSMPVHAYPDSRGPTNALFGANVPAWSPDGRTLAYEIGSENLTNKDSRIYLQPLGGARGDGPANPATNPRWWTDGKDTSLIWCTSGGASGWADKAASTLRQKFAGGALTGAPETLTQGAFNSGLSRDGRFLASAYPYAVMRDRQVGVDRLFHIYPGHPKAADGSNTDSLQACNGSVSADPLHPGRMLFLDFGVADEPSYANIVSPRLYAQHRMILIGDFDAASAGRLVDFIDSPAAELAAENTWDDPEWTNAPDFVVATNRDPDGDKSVPSEPKPTQPDIFLIKLSTKESLRVFHGTHQLLPTAWIGPK